MRTCVCAVLLLTACGSPPPPSSSAPPSTVAVASAPASVVAGDPNRIHNDPAPAALPPHTTWHGRYVCAQGVTALTLTLDLDATGGARALFAFSAAPENPTVPSGSYTLTGTLAHDATGTSLHLVPERWIDRPRGYGMVGLSALVDASAYTMHGNIEYEGCTALDLTRVP